MVLDKVFVIHLHHEILAGLDHLVLCIWNGGVWTNANVATDSIGIKIILFILYNLHNSKDVAWIIKLPIVVPNCEV